MLVTSSVVTSRRISAKLAAGGQQGEDRMDEPWTESDERDYQRGLRQAERFWQRIDRGGGPDACWPWTGARCPSGYGRVKILGRCRSPHRFALEWHIQDLVPTGLVVMHSCDNRLCCNPAHLSIGTYKDNAQDAARKGRLSVKHRRR